MNDAARRIVVFARVPRLGRVKTRLAQRIGEAGALAAHRELLACALSTAGAAGPDTLELCIAGHDEDGECARLAAAHGALLAAQRGDSLGERMEHALRRALEAGERPVLIGCDIPSLSAEDLADAFDALAGHDAVFAPTEDGGYALVGCRRAIGAIFESIDWGTDGVMAATRERLRAAGIGWTELRTVWDVDDAAGWQRWCALRGSVG